LDLTRVVNPLANIRRVFFGRARRERLVTQGSFDLNINLVK